MVYGPAAQGVGLLFGTLKDGSKGGTGEYGGAVGFPVCAQIVGYNTIGGQECETAFRKVDPAALWMKVDVY